MLSTPSSPAPSGAAPRSSSAGTTGRRNTTTECHRRSTVSASAFVGPRSSSVPTPNKATSITSFSVDAINKFIEDNFVGSQRLDPATDGRPDSRPVVRESSPQLGDVSTDFNLGPTSCGTHPPSPHHDDQEGGSGASGDGERNALQSRRHHQPSTQLWRSRLSQRAVTGHRDC